MCFLCHCRLNRSALYFQCDTLKMENTSFFIIWGDSKLLICPLGCVRPGKVTLHKDKEPLNRLTWWFIQVQDQSRDMTALYGRSDTNLLPCFGYMRDRQTTRHLWSLKPLNRSQTDPYNGPLPRLGGNQQRK